MQKQYMSYRQAITSLIAYLCGSSIVLGGYSKVEQDSWICTLLSLVLAVPVVLIYARLMKLYPETDIYGIIEQVCSPFTQKLITLFITWYALHLGAIVLRNYSEFTEIVAMPETPQLPIMVTMILIGSYIAKSGLETFGKWGMTCCIVLVSTIFLTLILLLNQMDFTNLLPIGDHAFKELANGGFNLFSFPFGESVLFLSVVNAVKKDHSPYRMYLYAILFAAFLLIVISIRNIVTIGPILGARSYFPSYVAARIINVSEVLVRLEGSISINFVLGGILKISVCIFAAAKGLCHLFNIQETKILVMPVSLIMLALSPILYSSAMQMITFIRVYPYYAFPFQILIPIFLWINAEIKAQKALQQKNAA